MTRSADRVDEVIAVVLGEGREKYPEELLKAVQAAVETRMEPVWESSWWPPEQQEADAAESATS